MCFWCACFQEVVASRDGPQREGDAAGVVAPPHAGAGQVPQQAQLRERRTRGALPALRVQIAALVGDGRGRALRGARHRARRTWIRLRPGCHPAGQHT